jgi:hypothetical protein
MGCRDAFRSVKHDFLEKNLKNLSNYDELNELIIGSYKNISRVIMRLKNMGDAADSDSIEIKR